MGEALLDTSTATKRSRLAKIVGGWIDGCATSGFQAVEPDNLDSYERSDGLLTPEHNAAFAKLLADRAHAAGLAIGQKNTTDLLERRKEIGFDFAVVEECGRYDECGDFADAYDDRVFVVEYADRDFARACVSVGRGRPSSAGTSTWFRPGVPGTFTAPAEPRRGAWRYPDGRRP